MQLQNCSCAYAQVVPLVPTHGSTTAMACCRKLKAGNTSVCLIQCLSQNLARLDELGQEKRRAAVLGDFLPRVWGPIAQCGHPMADRPNSAPN